MTKRFLTRKEQFLLTKFIEEKYVSSKLNDEEFATLAAAELGFKMSYRQVAETRKAFEIPANRPRAVGNSMAASIQDLQKRLDEAEQAIALLQKQVAVLQHQGKLHPAPTALYGDLQRKTL